MLRTEHSKKISVTFISACLIAMLFLTGCVQKNVPSPKTSDSYTNNIGMTFVPIPGKQYAMQITEVTIEQWFKVMGNPISWNLESRRDNPQYPMTLILSWEIREFIDRLNALEGKNVYRLPTRWEWAHACKAGTNTKWYFGNNKENLKDNAWFFDNTRGNIQLVGQKKPNPFGLFDMYGNAGEFTSTCGRKYSSDVLFANKERNPERCGCYILKGGSASSSTKQMSHAGTYCHRVGSPGGFNGFRLVMGVSLRVGSHR